MWTNHLYESLFREEYSKLLVNINLCLLSSNLFLCNFSNLFMEVHLCGQCTQALGTAALAKGKPALIWNRVFEAVLVSLGTVCCWGVHRVPKPHLGCLCPLAPSVSRCSALQQSVMCPTLDRSRWLGDVPTKLFFFWIYWFAEMEMC